MYDIQNLVNMEGLRGILSSQLVSPACHKIPHLHGLMSRLIGRPVRDDRWVQGSKQLRQPCVIHLLSVVGELLHADAADA